MTVEQAREVLAVEIEGLNAVKDRLGEEFEQAIKLIMNCPTRLVISGIGKSGIIGQKISATLNSTGTPSFFLHPVEAMHGDLGMLTSSDVVLALSYSGETAELNSLLASLRDRAVKIIAMTGNVHSTMAAYSDVILNVQVPKEACPLGLAPTTSTTACLVLGDALAVALLKRKQFKKEDFRRNHPGGNLGERLKISVIEVMITGNNIPLVDNTSSLIEAIEALNDKSLGAVIVVNKEKMVTGILTDGDVRRLVLYNERIEDLDLDKVVTENPVTISSGLLAADALSIMQRHEITILPVIDDRQKLQGILHLHDLLGKGEFRFLI